MCEVSSWCGCFGLRSGCLLAALVTLLACLVQIVVLSCALAGAFSTCYTKETNATISNTTITPTTAPATTTTACTTTTTTTTSTTTTTTTTTTTLPAEVDPGSEGSASNDSFSSFDDADDGHNSTSKNGDATALAPAMETSSDEIGHASRLEDTSEEASKAVRSTMVCAHHGLLTLVLLATLGYVGVCVLLVRGVLASHSWCLSWWLFYTVVYDLLSLIVALQNPTHLGPTQITTYVVVSVSVYNIIVVDSYYESVSTACGGVKN